MIRNACSGHLRLLSRKWQVRPWLMHKTHFELAGSRSRSKFRTLISTLLASLFKGNAKRGTPVISLQFTQGKRHRQVTREPLTCISVSLEWFSQHISDAYRDPMLRQLFQMYLVPIAEWFYLCMDGKIRTSSADMCKLIVCCEQETYIVAYHLIHHLVELYNVHLYRQQSVLSVEDISDHSVCNVK